MNLHVRQDLPLGSSAFVSCGIAADAVQSHATVNYGAGLSVAMPYGLIKLVQCYKAWQSIPSGVLLV